MFWPPSPQASHRKINKESYLTKHFGKSQSFGRPLSGLVEQLFKRAAGLDDGASERTNRKKRRTGVIGFARTHTPENTREAASGEDTAALFPTLSPPHLISSEALLSSALCQNSFPLRCRPASRKSPVDFSSIPAMSLWAEGSKHALCH